MLSKFAEKCRAKEKVEYEGRDKLAMMEKESKCIVIDVKSRASSIPMLEAVFGESTFSRPSESPWLTTWT